MLNTIKQPETRAMLAAQQRAHYANQGKGVRMQVNLHEASRHFEAEQAKQKAAAQARINRQRKADKAAADAEANQRFKAILKQWLLYAVAITTVIYALYRAWGQS